MSSGQGLRLRGFQPEVVTLGDGVTERDLLVHDEEDENLAYLLSRLTPPDFPMPLGVFRRSSFLPYEQGVHAQIAEARRREGAGDLLDLIHRGDTWEVP